MAERTLPSIYVPIFRCLRSWVRLRLSGGLDDLFLRTLAGSGRLVVYDKPGIGSSDPIDPDRGFLDRMDKAHVAVLDAVGAEAAWIVGSTLLAIARRIQTHGLVPSARS